MNHVPTSIGRYDVERLLGEGGMGVLYLARDPVLDRHVALKLLRVNGEDLRRRFMREAQSAARLQHPNIVTVYDVGDHDGQLYIAMEYIDGDTLATLIRDDAPFSAVRKLDIIDEVADGLGFAHQRGIIHRDIKPANLMMSRGGLVKVLDFGIARVAHRESREIDAPTLIGTPAYMAPEQLEGAEVDARSDIYAVGLVMYEFFSGQRAFSGATTADVLQKVLDSQPVPIEDLVRDIDADLCKVIGRAMARQPADRYPDLQAMRKDLARARRRALQASADDATIVVGLPVTRPVGQATATTTGSVPSTVVPPPTPPLPSPPTSAQPVASPPTAADRGLAHLAAQRASTTRPVDAVLGRDHLRAGRCGSSRYRSSTGHRAGVCSAVGIRDRFRSGRGPSTGRRRAATAVAESRADACPGRVGAARCRVAGRRRASAGSAAGGAVQRDPSDTDGGARHGRRSGDCRGPRSLRVAGH